MTMSTSKLLPKPPTTSASGTQTEANEVCKPHRHRARGGRRRGRKPHPQKVEDQLAPPDEAQTTSVELVAAEPPPPTLAEMSEDVREELNTIASAFADLVTLNDDGRVYVALANGVDIVFTLPTGYPSSCHPRHNICAPASLGGGVQRRLNEKLNDTYKMLAGYQMLITCIAEADAFVRSAATTRERTVSKSSEDGSENLDASSITTSGESAEDVASRRFNWISGECLEDRKSVFQAHILEISSRDEIMPAIDQLKENSKIARATHNMYSYVLNTEGIEQSDNFDDGEKGAGIKLAHLMRMMAVSNRLVVVTRWYGGVHLSTDRFRHICNVAREIITHTSRPKQ